MIGAGVQVAPHFVPLHTSPFGQTLNAFLELPRTDRLAASLVRLPIYPGLRETDVAQIVEALQGALSRSGSSATDRTGHVS